MTLINLIETLRAAPQDAVLRHGFTHPHSYRGYYDELAFEPTENVSIQSMLELAESALGKTFQGYKGGDYEMGPYTGVWLANYGDCGEELGPTLLQYMIADKAPSVINGNAKHLAAQSSPKPNSTVL